MKKWNEKDNRKNLSGGRLIYENNGCQQTIVLLSSFQHIDKTMNFKTGLKNKVH